VGRHSDSIDVTGPIDMTEFDSKRRTSVTLFVVTAVFLVVAVAVVLLVVI
jgi:hypothetical protein